MKYQSTVVNLREDRFFSNVESLIARGFAKRRAARADRFRAQGNISAKLLEHGIPEKGIIVQEDGAKVPAKLGNGPVQIGLSGMLQRFLPVSILNGAGGLGGTNLREPHPINRAKKSCLTEAAVLPEKFSS